MEFSETKGKTLEDVFQKAPGTQRAAFKKPKEVIQEAFSALTEQVAPSIDNFSEKRSKRVKKNKNPRVTPAIKTKKKSDEAAIEYYASSILAKYEAELSREPDVENRFGKIIDWGDIPLDDVVEKLVITLETLCNVTLFPYQKIFAARVMQSVLINDGEEVTACWSRQSGKTETITDVVATLMVMLPILAEYFPPLAQFKEGVYVGVFAPTEPQALTIAERFRMRVGTQLASDFLQDPEVDIIIDNLRMSNGSFVRIHSAAPQSKIESKTYHVIIIDEAQDVSEDKIAKSIHPMAAATSGTIIKLGTPHMRQCEFLDAIQRNKRFYEMSRGKTKNHFEFDYRTVIKYNARYARFIEKEKARYGEDSDYFRMSYKLEWLLSKGMAVTVEMFDKTMKYPSGRIENTPDPGYMYVMGIDLGKKFDSTVVTVIKLVKRDKPPRAYTDEFMDKDDVFLESDMYYKQVVNWWEYEGDNWEAQIDEFVRICNKYTTLQTICIDSTGVGDPIHEILSRRLSYKDISVIPVYFSLNQQHSLAQMFYKNVNHQSIRIPAHANVKVTRKYKKFTGQLLDAEKIWKNDKMVVRHSTAKGAKDDYVQSLFLALMAAEETMNTGSVKEYTNYSARGERLDDDNYINLVDGELQSIDMENVVGFENIRTLAREGRLTNRASFGTRHNG